MFRFTEIGSEKISKDSCVQALPLNMMRFSPSREARRAKTAEGKETTTKKKKKSSTNSKPVTSETMADEAFT